MQMIVFFQMLLCSVRCCCVLILRATILTVYLYFRMQILKGRL